jgi:hypothetical protein
MLNASIADLAWLAGIIDGEGCITVCGNRASSKRTDFPEATYVSYLTIGNTKREMLERIAEILGFGKVEYWSNDRQRVFRWRVASVRKVNSIIRLVKAMLVNKRYVGELVLIYGNTQIMGSYRPRLSDAVVNERKKVYLAIREANRRFGDNRIY